jgi:hypothetical protein
MINSMSSRSEAVKEINEELNEMPEKLSDDKSHTNQMRSDEDIFTAKHANILTSKLYSTFGSTFMKN